LCMYFSLGNCVITPVEFILIFAKGIS